MFYKVVAALSFYLSSFIFSNIQGVISVPLPSISLPSISLPSTQLPSALISPPLPIVLLHGLASNADTMYPFGDWIATTFQRPVINMEIGNGIETSIYTPITLQLFELCQNIYDNEQLKYGFDFIGMSQGGLLARGYVERCNAYPVRNLITLVSPHGGTLIKKLNVDMYLDFYQNHLSVSNYWRDPRILEEYLMKCAYLPILNNEVTTFLFDENDYAEAEADDTGYLDDIYLSLAIKQRNHIRSLNNLVLIWSPNDKVLYPPQSAIFSFYNDQFTVIPLEETDLYQTDALGLKYLNENDKLHTYQTNCSHEDHRNQFCFDQLYPIFKLYL